jgi:glycosyltransferase involved in cell wall biosynthesis
LKRNNIDLYHGLSHEIPIGIERTGIASVVTMHDLIHRRYSKQFNFFDVKTYNRKSRYACKNANKIIAISKQTKQDIIEFYGIPEKKIDVCYQSCNSSFATSVSDEQKKSVKEKYGLPDNFFLYVGSIIERKNLLNICKALVILKDRLNIPLLVIGKGKKYKHRVKDYILKNRLQKEVIFFSEHSSVKNFNSVKIGEDFPAIYQSAKAMIYPSIFEGFGIPVLEALFSKLPVITSNVSSLPEVGGDAAYYINPLEPEEIAAGMEKVATDTSLALNMQEKGWLHAQNFTQLKCATSVMNVYKTLID